MGLKITIADNLRNLSSVIALTKKERQSIQKNHIRTISQADKFLALPTIRQSTEYSCGAASFLSVLAFYGYDLPEKEVRDALGTTTGGTDPDDFTKAAKKFGLKSLLRENLTQEDLKTLLNKSLPVIIGIQAWDEDKEEDYSNEWGDGHYVVVIGYDKEGFYVMDPSQMGFSYLTKEDLEERWHDINKDRSTKYNHLGIIIYGKEPKFDPKEVNPVL